MILSFINIRKVLREMLKTEGEMLKTEGFALGFQHLLRDLENVNELKSCLIPIILTRQGQISTRHFNNLFRKNNWGHLFRKNK